MVESIMTYVSGAIILITSLFAYVYMVACVLPNYLIRPEYNNEKIRDRGIKKYIFDKGRAIVYDPAISVKEYIDQYVLFDDGEKRFLQCKVNEAVYSVNLRILTFDAFDKPLGVFVAKDVTASKNTTGIIELPIETSYVSIEVAEINNKRVNMESAVYFSVIKLGLFCLLTTAATVIEAVFIKSALLLVADEFFDYSNAVGAGNAYTVFVAILLGIASSILILLLHNSRDIKSPIKSLFDGLVSWVRTLIKK